MIDPQHRWVFFDFHISWIIQIRLPGFFTRAPWSLIPVPPWACSRNASVVLHRPTKCLASASRQAVVSRQVNWHRCVHWGSILTYTCVYSIYIQNIQIRSNTYLYIRRIFLEYLSFSGQSHTVGSLFHAVPICPYDITSWMAIYCNYCNRIATSSLVFLFIVFWCLNQIPHYRTAASISHRLPMMIIDACNPQFAVSWWPISNFNEKKKHDFTNRPSSVTPISICGCCWLISPSLSLSKPQQPRHREPSVTIGNHWKSPAAPTTAAGRRPNEAHAPHGRFHPVLSQQQLGVHGCWCSPPN